MSHLERLVPRHVDVAEENEYRLGGFRRADDAPALFIAERADSATYHTRRLSPEPQHGGLRQCARMSPEVASQLGLPRAFGKKLCLDENHQALGHHAVMRHGLGSRPGLHRAHDGVHVGNVHKHCYSGRVLRVDERADVGDAEGAKELFALRRGKPMILVLDFVVCDHGGHRISSLSWPSSSARPRSTDRTPPKLRTRSPAGCEVDDGRVGERAYARIAWSASTRVACGLHATE